MTFSLNVVQTQVVGGCGELDTNPSKGACWPIFVESSDF